MKKINPREYLKKTTKSRTLRTNILLVVSLIFVVILCLFTILGLDLFVKKYRKNTYNDSVHQLEELSEQINLYVTENLEKNWKIIDGISIAVQNKEFENNQEIINYLDSQKQLWKFTTVYIVNEDKDTLCNSDFTGDKLTKSIVNNFISKAKENNDLYFATSNDLAMYTLTMNSRTSFNSKKVIGAILVQDLTNLIDSLTISSFGKKASLYLADTNGIIMSRLTSDNIDNSITLDKVLNDNDSYIKSDITLQDIKDSSEQLSFLCSSNGKDSYGIISNVEVRGDKWSFLYIVPVKVVNESIDGFYQYVILLSIVGIFIIIIISVIVFVFILKYQSKTLSTELSIREKLVDVLVSETSNAFALLKEEDKEPMYITSNYKKLIQSNNKMFYLTRENGKLKLDNKDQKLSDQIYELSSEIMKWNGRDPFISSYINIGNSNNEKFIVFKLYPISGTEDEYICIISDVTEERKRENILKIALNNADAANKAKTEFLANMSHDIRTPMNAIINMTNLAIDNIQNKEQVKEYLEIVIKSSKHLLNLINDVLEVSRIESGKIVFNQDPFNLYDSIENVISIIKPLCDNKNQTLAIDLSGLKHKEVKGDKTKVEQIVLNVLNNACKFTPENGIIELIVNEQTTLKSEYASYIFTIKDNGIGIPNQYLDRIYDPFIKVNNKMTTQSEGTGLGLSIAKNFINGMGGTIKCSSEEGKGTVFTIGLFFERNYQKENKSILDFKYETSDCSLADVKVLLVEDNKINQIIASSILEQWGIKVDIADDGQDAVKMILDFSHNQYDMVFMDIQMNVMNGYEATKAIRNCNVESVKNIPIVAMTANVFAEDIEKAMKSGMNGHIGKPINTNELRKIIEKILNR